jgi:hypothetical protein
VRSIGSLGRSRGRAALWFAAAALLTAPAARALAQGLEPGSGDNETEEDESREVEIHGFVSQGYIKTNKNNYLTATDSRRGSFEFSEAGINLTKILNDKLRLGVQLFTRDLGPLGNYQATFDWFYLDYRFADWLGIRAGRTKLPWGLYNELGDVDAARVPVLLPQSVYPIRSRNYLLAQTGAELYGFVQLGPAGGVEYRIYGGTIFIDSSTSGPYKTESLTVPYLIGGRLLWETPLLGLRAGGSLQALRLNYDFSSPTLVGHAGAPGGIARAAIPAVLWVGSLEYAGPKLLLASEYGRWHVEIQDSIPEVIPQVTTVSERFYVMGAYRLSPWFTPGLYYSMFYRDKDKRDSREDFQSDLALTLKFDLGPHWLLKLEGHYMDGTADLTPALNPGAALSALPETWFLFLAKTTVYF